MGALGIGGGGKSMGGGAGREGTKCGAVDSGGPIGGGTPAIIGIIGVAATTGGTAAGLLDAAEASIGEASSAAFAASSAICCLAI